MNTEDFPSDSDTSDEDYVPTGADDISDAEPSEGEGHSGDECQEQGGERPLKKNKKFGKKRKTEAAAAFSRKRQGGIYLEEEDTEENTEVSTKESSDDHYNRKLEETIEQEKEEKKVENEKKKADSLWADFMKDVGAPKPKPKPATSSLGSFSSVKKPITQAKPVICSPVTSERASTASKAGDEKSKITITKEYDFAGEIVKVTKEVDADSKEAKLEMRKQEEACSAAAAEGPTAVKRPFAGGLGSVLGKIGKKPKMGTLEKSKIDWDDFKKKENISEDLEVFNRGKEGYLERKAFLERTDLRQYEQERTLRMGSTSKR